jgi:hypothetical protein
MKLWLISQDVNTGYDTYDSAVVAAPDEESARRTHPSGPDKDGSWLHPWDWARSPDQVTAELIGEAAPGMTARVICASFNAG